MFLSELLWTDGGVQWREPFIAPGSEKRSLVCEQLFFPAAFHNLYIPLDTSPAKTYALNQVYLKTEYPDRLGW